MDMLKLDVDFSQLSGLAAVAAALKHGSVKIEPNTKKITSLQTESGKLRSISAIVCYLLNSDPLIPVFSNVLLSEFSLLRFTLLSNDNHAEVPLILKNAESILLKASELSPSCRAALELLIWADLVPIFAQDPNKLNNLKEFAESMHSQPFCSKALGYFKNHASLELKIPSKNEKSGDVKKEPSNKAPQKSAYRDDTTDSDEFSKLQIEVTPEQMLKAQWVFSTHDHKYDQKPELDKNGLKRPAKKNSGIRNILVTSALPYVNNVPHLGNLIGSLLSADIFSIYCDLVGYNVLSICGTDEYGTATEAKAQTEGLTPQQITDKYSALHCKIYDWFDIHFDYFGRTSTLKHTEITQEIFGHLYKKDYITENSVEQLVCESCSRALADRFVEGVCPFCKSNDARGDQCDTCGRLINAIDLIEPRCSTCGAKPHVKSSEHLFLDLPKLEKKVAEFVNNRLADPSAYWTPVAESISRAWLRDGLKQRCITRDLKWGVPVPLDKFNEKVFYVWFDAPMGYMSITANYTADWRLWWQPPADIAPVEYFQFMAKDNVPFHSCIFPACLLGVDSGFTLVKNLVATDYLNYEGKKFSKSRNIGVFGDNARDSGIDSNIWRFYLAYIRPETQDTTFSWEDFAAKNNSELLNNLGNFIYRSFSFLSKFFVSSIPKLTSLQPDDVAFLARVNAILKNYLECMERCQLRDSLRCILSVSRLGNGYLQTQQPWKLMKVAETVERAGVVTGVACNIAALLGLMLKPFMPSISKEICDQCNLPIDRRNLAPIRVNQGHTLCFLPHGHKIGETKPLFKKIEPEEIQWLKSLYDAS